MSMLLPVVVVGEAVVLLVLVAAMLRLRGQVRDVDEGASVTLVQMRELVQEAQSLSTMLASQLAAQVTLAEQAASGSRKPAAEARPIAAPPAKATAVPPARPVLPTAIDLEREAARERGMDPLGLALQRSLHRGAQPVS